MGAGFCKHNHFCPTQRPSLAGCHATAQRMPGSAVCRRRRRRRLLEHSQPLLVAVNLLLLLREGFAHPPQLMQWHGSAAGHRRRACRRLAHAAQLALQGRHARTQRAGVVLQPCRSSLEGRQLVLGKALLGAGRRPRQRPVQLRQQAQALAQVVLRRTNTTGKLCSILASMLQAQAQGLTGCPAEQEGQHEQLLTSGQALQTPAPGNPNDVQLDGRKRNRGDACVCQAYKQRRRQPAQQNEKQQLLTWNRCTRSALTSSAAAAWSAAAAMASAASARCRCLSSSWRSCRMRCIGVLAMQGQEKQVRGGPCSNADQ